MTMFTNLSRRGLSKGLFKLQTQNHLHINLIHSSSQSPAGGRVMHNYN